MDRDLIVGQLMNRCKCVIEPSLEAADLHSVAMASGAIFEPMRDVARAILRAKVDLEAHKLHSQAVPPCCPEAALTYVHTRTVQPTTLFGAIEIPVRPYDCHDCGASRRSDDTPLGVPPVGDFPDDVRMLSPPFVAELPHRVAHAILARFTGGALSSRGAQGLIDSSAADHCAWRRQAEGQDHTAVAEGLAGQDASRLRLEMAMDGVKAPIDRRWQAPKVATVLVRHLRIGAHTRSRARPPLCLCAGHGGRPRRA